MKRAGVLALLAAALALGTAWAGDYSGMTTMTFQNGVAPTAGYTGTDDTFIVAATADSAKNFGSSDSLKVSAASWTGPFQPGIHRAMVRFDISALPDSAIITDAKLYLYQNLGTTGANTDTAHVYRLGLTWVEGTGAALGTTSTTTARWRNYGSVTQQWNIAGASSKGFRFQYPTASFGSGVDSSVTASVYGTDTQALGVLTFDTPFVADAMNILYTGIGSLRQGWQIYDVTHTARLWHNEAITNNGVLIEVHSSSNNKMFSFWSSEYANKPYRPKLIIKYFDPTSGSSGGSGRRIIGGSGAGIQ